MKTVREVVREIGSGKICGAIGVTKPAVSNAVKDGKFAASWYAEIIRLCDQEGLEQPGIELFNFKRSGQEAAE